MYQVLYVLDFQFCEFLHFAFSPLFCTWLCFLFHFFFLFVCGMVLWSYFNKTNKLLTKKLKMNFCLWHVFIYLHELSRNNWPCENFVFFQAYYNYASFILAWFSIFNVHAFARCDLVCTFWLISLVPTLMWNYLKNSSSNVLNNENHLVW